MLRSGRARSPALSPAGPCVTAQSLTGVLSFPGLVIIISFLPRNAAPVPTGRCGQATGSAVPSDADTGLA